MKEFSEVNTIRQWSGRVIDWFFIELMIYFNYFCTLGLLLLKSRCSNVGVNTTREFMPHGMMLMANSLLKAADFKTKFKKRSYEVLKKRFVNKAFFIDIEGVEIMVSLNEHDFQRIHKKTHSCYHSDKSFIKVHDATDWIERVVCGNICKNDLDV